MFERQITSDQVSQVVANTLRGNGRSSVVFTKMAPVVADRPKPDEFDGTVRPSLHFSVRSSHISTQSVRRAQVNQSVIRSDYGDTLSSARRS